MTKLTGQQILHTVETLATVWNPIVGGLVQAGVPLGEDLWHGIRTLMAAAGHDDGTADATIAALQSKWDALVERERLLADPNL